MLAKGALEIARDPGPGFYSRLFLVEKATGGWRPLIDLSHLNDFVQLTPFKMETVASVLLSVREGDFLASLDLKDAYFQIPIHGSSRKLLRFMSEGTVYQFKALCFGLSTAPQVFTRVFAAVSAWAHARGIRLLRYLLLRLSSQVLRIQKMTLLTLVHLGDGPTITFTAATPVQPGPSHPEDDPAYAGPSRRRSYDSPLDSFRYSSRQGSDTPPRKRRRL